MSTMVPRYSFPNKSTAISLPAPTCVTPSSRYACVTAFPFSCLFSKRTTLPSGLVLLLFSCGLLVENGKIGDIKFSVSRDFPLFSPRSDSETDTRRQAFLRGRRTQEYGDEQKRAGNEVDDQNMPLAGFFNDYHHRLRHLLQRFCHFVFCRNNREYAFHT